MDIEEAGKRVLRIEAEAVRAIEGRIGADFVRAVELIASGTGRLIVSGMGKSGLVGKKIAATMASTGTPSFFLHPAEACHGDLGMVQTADILLAISHSGETEEIVALLPFIKRFGIGLIAMTGRPASTLARAADVHLDVSVAEEACPMGIVPTASTTAALAMGDALAVALLERRGFGREDFAVYHPKGVLGKKLLTRVRDLMHAGETVPAVGPEAPMTEIVVEMSSKRLGVTTVRDDRGDLLGVISDGDIRRGVERHGERIFQLRARDVMTASPRTVPADMLAAEALAIMERHAVTSLLVTGEGGALAGVLHIHDVLREGIA
jgi:arabinose-5-phosphate isomerase